ncbi:MAG: hypothetical protein FWD34_00220 [Oscillospiraceae bacterium]|nr:hypothetical protein [Oscillospiraceae bacterium]
MSDKFSVDDILKELDGKKKTPYVSAASAETDEKPQPLPKPVPAPPTLSKEDAESLTAELAEIEKRRFGAKPVQPPKKPEISVTQIINTIPKKADSLDSDTGSEKEFKPVKPVKIQRFQPPEKTVKPAPKKETTPTPQAVSEKPPENQSKKIVDKPTVELEKPLEAEPVRRIKRHATHEISVLTKTGVALLEPPAPIEKAPVPKPNYLLPEEKERLQKLREEELLQKDLSLEDPDDIIDGINPYDVKELETPVEDADVIGVKITRDLGDDEDDYDEDDASDSLEQVKEYTPSFSKPLAKNSVDPKVNRSNTALLESLNSALAKKRESDINARRTLTVETLSSVASGGDYKGRTLPSKLNIDYKKQIIEDSAVLPSSDLMFRQLEERELGKKKKRKIRDFILEDLDEDDYEEEDDDNKDGESDEFDDFDAGTQIWEDLNESHKGLKWRFVLLFLLTACLTFVTFLHDSSVDNPLRKYIINELFGSDFNNYTTTLILINLIAGVIGMSLCSGVILRGIQGVFTRKADCDSIVAIPCVLTVAAAAVHLNNTNLFQQGHAHIYVSVALMALTLNTLGKLMMIARAKRNFRFISGDSVKYFAHMADSDEAAGALTKGILTEMHAPVFLRKTEFLTDYLKNSYCTDLADLICRKLAPISAIVAVLTAVIAYFVPVTDPALVEMQRNFVWAATAGGAFIVLASPFSIMFLVNNPLLRASKSLSKSDSVVMGYKAAQRFSKANAVVLDAGLLFPPGSVKFLNVKRCQKPGTLNSVSIDESIVIAASLAIKTNSIMTHMFYDMISGDDEILYKIENCIYEVNMGITGWMGTKRVMLGNREQMKHHSIDVPELKKERKHCPDNGEVVYLAVGGETIAMFFIEVLANPAVKLGLKELEFNGIALAVKTKDSLVSVNKIADIFEINPEKIKILPFDLHKKFDDYSRYTSRGSSEIACNGTFTSLAKALVCAKTMMRDMTVTSASMLTGLFLAGGLGLIFVLFVLPGMLTASSIIVYNLVWLVIMLVLQGLRRY